jgi:hypothetical protein
MQAETHSLVFCTIPTRFLYISLHYNPVLHHKDSFVLAAVFCLIIIFARDQKRLISLSYHIQPPKERERSTTANERSPPPRPIHPHHRVGKVLSFFSSRRNWDSPNPSTAGEWCAPPPVSGGRGTLAGERGVGRVPIPTRGHSLWYSLYIRTLWLPLSTKFSWRVRLKNRKHSGDLCVAACDTIKRLRHFERIRFVTQATDDLDFQTARLLTNESVGQTFC